MIITSIILFGHYTSNFSPSLVTTSQKIEVKFKGFVRETIANLVSSGDSFWDFYFRCCAELGADEGKKSFDAWLANLGGSAQLAKTAMAISTWFKSLPKSLQRLVLSKADSWSVSALKELTKASQEMVRKLVNQGKQTVQSIRCALDGGQKTLVEGERAMESDWQLVQRKYKVDEIEIDAIKLQAERIADVTENGLKIVTTDNIVSALTSLGYDATKILPKPKKQYTEADVEDRTKQAVEVALIELEREIQEKDALIERLQQQINSRRTTIEAQNTSPAVDSSPTNNNNLDLLITIADISVEEVAPTVPQESASVLEEEVALSEEPEFSVETEDSVATVNRDRTSNDRTAIDNIKTTSRIELSQLPPVVVGVEESVDLTGKIVKVKNPVGSEEFGTIVGFDRDRCQVLFHEVTGEEQQKLATIADFSLDELEILTQLLSFPGALVKSEEQKKQRTFLELKQESEGEPVRRRRSRAKGFGSFV